MILNWFFHQTLNHYFSYIGSKENKMRKIWPLKVYSNLNSLMALSVEKMGLVTCYEFFIGLSKNWEWGGEMPYHRYKLKCYGSCLVIADMGLAGMVDSYVTL